MLNTVIQDSLNRSPEYKRFLEETAAADALRIKRIADQASAPLRQANAAMKKLMIPIWSKPVSALKQMFRQAQGNKTLLTTWYWNVLLRPDTEMIPQDQTEAAQTFDEFVEKTLPSQGWRLSVAGCTRLWAFCYVQREAGGNAITPENLALFFQELQTNGCFDAETAELSYTEPLRAPEPEVAPTLDDLDHIDTGTPEGFRAAKYLCDRLYNGEASEFAALWLRSLAENFNGFAPTQDDLDYSIRWFEQNNKSWLDGRSYDGFRLHMVRTGRWYPAERFMTHEEIKAAAIDRLDMSDRDVRSVVLNGKRDVLLDLLRRHRVSLI